MPNKQLFQGINPKFKEKLFAYLRLSVISSLHQFSILHAFRNESTFYKAISDPFIFDSTLGSDSEVGPSCCCSWSCFPPPLRQK